LATINPVDKSRKPFCTLEIVPRLSSQVLNSVLK